MPKFVPSRVVGLIERRFGKLKNDSKIELTSAGVVAAILKSAELVPDACLSGLTPEEQDDVVVALSQMREVVAQWQGTTHSDYKTGGGAALGQTQALGDRHPVLVLKELLAKCPDDPQGVAVNTLAFLGDPDLSADLGADISTAFSTVTNGEFKASCVVAGAVIEALLLWGVKRKTADIPAVLAAGGVPGLTMPSNANPDVWGLAQLLSVAKMMPIVAAETFDAANQAREYRNLIHPGRAVRLGIRADQARAYLTTGAMLRVRDDLASRVAAGTL